MKKILQKFKILQKSLDSPHARWSLFRVQHPKIIILARAVTWLGNALPSLFIWGVLFAYRPWDVFPFVIAALVTYFIYKTCKKYFSRPRPFQSHHHIVGHTSPPDEFSFPSGHTSNATLMALCLYGIAPSLLIGLILFVCAMGASRVVLGMHYPSDVFAGILLGCITGFLAFLC